ncbi:MAG: ATP-dependent helicase [Sphingobacteriia bacterium]|nr:MAG: ATP-dependent helicase [Sphingobacteriia bacterium]
MLKKQDQEDQFKAVFAQLNPAQQAAVEALEGPVMVIAGPGTGKTQILSARIGKILLETDTTPDQILCLTYTDAGAIAMRKRLLQFIGPEAYQIQLSTFHAFCHDIIQDNLSRFEKSSLDPITELESTELFKELINGFPKNHPLKRYRGNVYHEINNLRNLFSSMKREGWEPATILAAIDTYLAELPQRDEYVYRKAYKQFKAGDLKMGKLIDAQKKMEKLKAAVQEFPRFQAMMLEKNRYDFDDMINWIIREFLADADFLLRYQEQYQYILVDEFQDTSGTQNQLVQLLSSYWASPNLFVVGDDDQSIYRFQGANIENMGSFADRYATDLRLVLLTQNYRSTQPILDLSKQLIDQNTERLINRFPQLDKTLVASRPERLAIDLTPSLLAYDDPEAEMMELTLAIQARLAQGQAPGSMAVIYRENRWGSQFQGFLKTLEIPFYTRRSRNLIEIPLAHRLFQLLRYIALENEEPKGGEEILFEILHYSWFGIAPSLAAKISLEVGNDYGNPDSSIRNWLGQHVSQPVTGLFDEKHPGIVQLHQLIESCLGDAFTLPLLELFQQLVSRSGALQAILVSPNKHQDLSILSAVYRFIEEETHRRPLMTCLELVQTLDTMQKEGISLDFSENVGTENGVNLLTAHGSKGLEFETVFLVGLNAQFWEKKRKPNGGYALPDTLFVAAQAGSDEEELRRLFYVALTRAEKELFLSYALFKTDGKPLEPSQFVAELQAGGTLVAAHKKTTDAVLDQFRALRIQPPAKPQIAALEAAVVDRFLEKFTMNVTALNNYLNCPLQFYYNNILRVPSGKSEAATFGSAVHHGLHTLFLHMQDQGDFPPVEKLIKDFELYLFRHREMFSKEELARRLEYGQTLLQDYYNRSLPTWNKVVSVEKNIRGVVYQQVPLKGKLDKLEFDGTMVNVVDYKTGNPDNAKEKLKGPNDKNPLGGDYWRQAVFYKILVDEYPLKNWQVNSTEFDFIEPDDDKNYQKIKINIAPSDVTTVGQQIRSAWEKIQQKDFYTGCGKDTCHWCQFTKNQDIAIGFLPLDEAEED